MAIGCMLHKFALHLQNLPLMQHLKDTHTGHFFMIAGQLHNRIAVILIAIDNMFYITFPYFQYVIRFLYLHFY